VPIVRVLLPARLAGDVEIHIESRHSVRTARPGEGALQPRKLVQPGGQIAAGSARIPRSPRRNRVRSPGQRLPQPVLDGSQQLGSENRVCLPVPAQDGDALRLRDLLRPDAGAGQFTAWPWVPDLYFLDRLAG